MGLREELDRVLQHVEYLLDEVALPPVCEYYSFRFEICSSDFVVNVLSFVYCQNLVF